MPTHPPRASTKWKRRWAKEQIHVLESSGRRRLARCSVTFLGLERCEDACFHLPLAICFDAPAAWPSACRPSCTQLTGGARNLNAIVRLPMLRASHNSAQVQYYPGVKLQCCTSTKLHNLPTAKFHLHRDERTEDYVGLAARGRLRVGSPTKQDYRRLPRIHPWTEARFREKTEFYWHTETWMFSFICGQKPLTRASLTLLSKLSNKP